VLTGHQVESPGVNDCPPDPPGGLLEPSQTSTLTPTPSPTLTVVSPLTLTASPSPTSSPTPTATPAQPTGGLTALQRRMEESIASYPVGGRYAVAVTDLQTGETIGVNAERRQLSGCSMNLFILLRITMDMQEGKYDEETRRTIDRLITSTTWSSNAQTARDLY